MIFTGSCSSTVVRLKTSAATTEKCVVRKPGRDIGKIVFYYLGVRHSISDRDIIISHPEILCRGPRFHPEMYLGVRDNYVWVRNTMSDPEIIKKNFPRCPFRASVVLPLQLLLHVTPHRSISRRSSLRTVQLRSRVPVRIRIGLLSY